MMRRPRQLSLRELAERPHARVWFLITERFQYKVGPKTQGGTEKRNRPKITPRFGFVLRDAVLLSAGVFWS